MNDTPYVAVHTSISLRMVDRLTLLTLYDLAGLIIFKHVAYHIPGTYMKGVGECLRNGSLHTWHCIVL